MSDRTFENTGASQEKWTAIAADVEPTTPNAPMSVITGEAMDISFLLDKYWEPLTTGKSPRPGIINAVNDGALEETIRTDLRELVVVICNTQAQYRAVTAETLDAPVERAEFLLSEIRQCLEYIFDDGVTDKQDAELARLTESHTDTSTHDALALSLEGFAYYANRFRERLSTLAEFDPAMLDEALVVANRLREQSGLKLSSDEREQQRIELNLRNRLLTLLDERVKRTRRAARFIFRNHPDIARLFGSSYERRSRARRRAAQRAAKEVTETEVSTA